MYPLVKEFVDAIQQKEPNTFSACYPRQIVTPTGYLNPKFFVCTLFTSLHTATEPELTMLPHFAGIISALKHVELTVPTYFVQSEFAQAVAQSNPPEDFKISEIKWPMDAMLFAIPTAFSLRYFGFMVPFISVVRAPAGNYPACVNTPKIDISKAWMRSIWNETDRLIITFPCFSQFEAPADYSAVFNMTHNIADVKHFEYQDASLLELKARPDLSLSLNQAVDLPKSDVEREFQDKVISYAIKLMLAVTAMPTAIETGAITRKASVKHGRTRDALWQPNTIGWQYRAVREHAPAVGTHASPRLHWRRGHWRNQPYGENSALRKLIWLQPVLVGSNA